MRFISTRSTGAALAVAICMAIPVTAQADSDAAQVGGDRPELAATSASSPADFGGGDNPADHPGMSRAPQSDGTTTIEVVRPERTIVRDVDEALPIALSGAALLLVLAALAGLLLRGRLVPRPHHRS